MIFIPRGKKKDFKDTVYRILDVGRAPWWTLGRKEIVARSVAGTTTGTLNSTSKAATVLQGISQTETQFDASSLWNFSRESRSRAVLIGIGYRDHVNREQWDTLDTTINDIRNMYWLLLGRGYKEFKILTDHPRPGFEGKDVELPTSEAIISAVKWLVEGAEAGDRLLMLFAGHGHQVPLELPNKDIVHLGAIVPLTTHGEETFILGYQLQELLIDSLSPGCRLLALFDCLGSGNLLGLPHDYSKRLPTEQLSFAPLHTSGLAKRALSELSERFAVDSIQVVTIAACQNDEQSFELDGKGGMLTTAFVGFMDVNDPRRATLKELSEYFSNEYQELTNWVHSSCQPEHSWPVSEGHCIDRWCPIPSNPPNPSIATLTNLSSDEPLLKGILD